MEFLTFDSEGEGGAVQYLDKADRVADRPDCDRAKLLLWIVTIIGGTRIKKRTITMSSSLPKMSKNI